MKTKPHASLYLRCLFLNLALAPAAFSQGAAPLFSGSITELSTEHKFQAALDLDHDGDQDLLSWWWFGEADPIPLPRATVRGLTLEGDGTLKMAWTFNSPFSNNTNCLYAGSAVGDFDGDGFDDFAIGIWGHVFVYATRAAAPPVLMENLTVPGTSAYLEELRAGDLNGDGLDDLIIGHNYNAKALLSNGWDAPFDFVGQVNIPGQASTFNHILLTMVDYDQDGREEAVTLRYNDDRMYVYGVENGAFVFEDILSTTMPFVHGFTTGDIDGDGDQDIVTFDQQGAAPGTYEVFRCSGPSAYASEGVTQGGPATHLIDIDADGDLDGLCCGGGPSCHWDNENPAVFQIALNDGTGAFDQAITIPSMESGYDGLAGVADLDGDGDLDMFGGRSVLINHLQVGASYCEPPANSTGEVGRLALSGSSSISRSDLSLHASNLPANKTSIIVLGGKAASTPIGASLLCIEAPLRRYALVQSDGDGNINLPIPIASLPPGFPGNVDPGETRRLQVWHRDTGAESFGFSEGISVTFAP